MSFRPNIPRPPSPAAARRLPPRPAGVGIFYQSSFLFEPVSPSLVRRTTHPTTRLLVAGLALLALLGLSCENPFAPPLGDPTSLWTDQSTVGGLLENFRSAYIHRDSLRYAECLACPDYQFNFFNTELGEYEMMPRETDLVSTGRLFRHYNEVDLRWVGLGEELAALETPDSLIHFTLLFELRLDQELITGHANFTVVKAAQVVEFCQSPIFADEPVFRIIQWDDDL